MANPSKTDKTPEVEKSVDGGVEQSSLGNKQKLTVEPEKDIFVWKEASRPFRKRSREFWVTVISIASLLAFILFLAEGVMPVILISSLVFLYYVMSTVNPEEVEYGITNRGLRVADATAPWGNLVQYWFGKRLGSDILVVETTSFPFRLELVISGKDIGKIKQILGDFIPEGKNNPTYLDKTVDWVAKKLPSN